jgi:hypothetical protein
MFDNGLCNMRVLLIILLYEYQNIMIICFCAINKEKVM